MSTKRASLRYDVFVAPELPLCGPSPRVANADPPAWDPKTATLIFGSRDAVLVDAFMTIRDTLDTTSLYVPDLGLIVSGDVAYNRCHMFVGQTTSESRAQWIDALDNAQPV